MRWLGRKHSKIMIAPSPDLDLDALLGDIGTKPTSKRASYPQMPDPDGMLAIMAQTSINLSEAADQLKTNNRLIGEIVRPYFFQLYAGKADTESSLRIAASDGKAVLLTMKNQCQKIESAKSLAPIQDIFAGRERDLFYSSFDIGISGDEIPTASIAPLVVALKELFAKHGASAALEVKRIFKPRPAFFTSRHTMFSVEENIKIDAVIPVISSVKVKGVE